MKSSLPIRKTVGIASIINGVGMFVFFGFILQIFNTEAYGRIRTVYAVFEFLHYLIASLVLIYFVKNVLEQDRGYSETVQNKQSSGHFKKITIKDSSFEAKPVKWAIGLIIVADFVVYVLALGNMIGPSQMETILLILGSISVMYGVLFFQRVRFEDEQQDRFRICYSAVHFIAGLLIFTIKFVPFAVILGCIGEVLMGHFFLSLWKAQEDPKGEFA